MTNKFNEYFTSVFTNEKFENILVPIKIYEGIKFLNKIDLSESPIEKVLAGLETEKRSKNDKIFNIALKYLRKYLTKLFELIFCYNFVHSQVPADWKEVNITPIYKGSQAPRCSASSYQPVSFTSQVSKVF